MIASPQGEPGVEEIYLNESSAQIRVFSVDDHPLLHEGLSAVIRHQSDMLWVAEADNGKQAIQLFQEHVPDVTLMDLRLPDMSGIDAMIAIRAQFPEARIIMLTTFANDVEIRRAFDAGARAYMLKSMPPKQLVEVIRQVHAGETRIPPEFAARQIKHDDETPPAPREKPVHAEEAVKINSNRTTQSCQGTLQNWFSHLFRRKS